MGFFTPALLAKSFQKDGQLRGGAQEKHTGSGEQVASAQRWNHVTPHRDSTCCHTPGHYTAPSVSRSAPAAKPLHVLRTHQSPPALEKPFLPSLSLFICKMEMDST